MGKKKKKIIVREKIIESSNKNPNINHPEILETIEVFCDSIKSALKENKNRA